MTDTAKHTLYICYFGLREPLVQTQVIPYLEELAKGGIKVSLLTFEPNLKNAWTPEQLASSKKELAKKDIEWDCLAYHKWPSAIVTAYDILAGTMFVRQKIRADKIDVLHGRVHVPALIGALGRKFSRHKPKLIFDIRGFVPEEYTDAGVWPENGWLFRAAKRVERWLLSESDAFVVLTKKAKNILFSNETKPVEVIPCCVDFEKRFATPSKLLREDIESKLNVKGRFVVAHVGALIGLYLAEEIVDLLKSARDVEPSTFALFLTQTDPANIISLLNAKGFTEGDYFVGLVDAAEIPKYLSIANVGVSFVKATYATQSRSPTKIPEYLAAGIPVIANRGVGDVDQLIKEEGVGVLLDRFDREAYENAVKNLKTLGDVGPKCRETAKRRFDLKTVGGESYRRLYRNILNDCK